MRKYQMFLCLVLLFLSIGCQQRNNLKTNVANNNEDMREIPLENVYEELLDSFPDKFVNENTMTIFNKNKEYIIRYINDFEKPGLEIIDISKLDIEKKIGKLHVYKADNTMSQVDNGMINLKWINEFLHPAMDAYNDYGEDFFPFP